MATRIYNPLEKLNLARSIRSEILSTEAAPLKAPHAISGAGVYVIYYAGPFAAYAGLALANAQSWARPIYIGKAIPKGGRKGGLSRDDAAVGTALSGRLRKHADSIESVTNLAIGDFAKPLNITL